MLEKEGWQETRRKLGNRAEVKSYSVCAQACDELTYIQLEQFFHQVSWLCQLHTLHVVTVVFPVVCICHLHACVKTEHSAFLQSACGNIEPSFIIF